MKQSAVDEKPPEMTEEKTMADEPIHDDFLVDVPDIPMPEEGVAESEVVNDEFESAFRYCFVGAGQGGSRIAESFYKLGYRRVCCINTNSQDLTGIDIPESSKLVMDVGSGGAGKDPKKGAEALKKYYEDVYDLMRRCFGTEFDRIFVCIGAGGGTGSGAAGTLIEIAHDIAKSLKVEDETTNTAVGAIVSLPKVAESAKVNFNACGVLNELFGKVGIDGGRMGGRSLSPLIIVDNDRINKLYPNVPVAQFWGVANKNISSLFHLFNTIAIRDSDFTSFDKADLKQILDSGVVTFGACPMRKHESSVDISQAIRENLRRNVLVGGFDLHSAKTAGCVFIGHTDVLNTIPQDYLEHGFEMLSRIMGASSVVHRGIYRGNKPGLVVYTILGELTRPEERLAEMAKVGGATVQK
jgi:cell division GTPase FtsZ